MCFNHLNLCLDVDIQLLIIFLIIFLQALKVSLYVRRDADPCPLQKDDDDDEDDDDHNSGITTDTRTTRGIHRLPPSISLRVFIGRELQAVLTGLVCHRCGSPGEGGYLPVKALISIAFHLSLAVTWVTWVTWAG